jgi:hypothetical protein
MLNYGIRGERLKKIGLCAAFVLVVASPEILHVAIAAPAARLAPAAQTTNANTFVPTCSANEVVDIRAIVTGVRTSPAKSSRTSVETVDDVDALEV